MYKRILFVLSLTIGMFAHADNNRLGRVYVSSANHDSIHVDGVFVGFTPTYLTLPEGSYEIKITNLYGQAEQKRVLIEDVKDDKYVHWIRFKTLPAFKPLWAKNITPEEKNVIEGILHKMSYISKTDIPKDAFRGYGLNPQYLDSACTGKESNEVHIPAFYVMRFCISIYEWETIMKTTFAEDIPNDIRKKALIKGIGITREEMQLFAKRVSALSGIQFALPSLFQIYAYRPKHKEDFYNLRSTYTLYKSPTVGSLYDKEYKDGHNSRGLSYPYYGEYTRESHPNQVYYIHENGEYDTSAYDVWYSNTETSRNGLKYMNGAAFRLVINAPSDINRAQANWATDTITTIKKAVLLQEKKYFEEQHRLASSGDADAMQRLGRLYLTNRGVDVDESEAYRWTTEAIKAGNELALFDLAYYSKWGIAGSIDYSKVTDIYQYLSDKGNLDATAMLSQSYILAHGVHQEWQKSIDLAKKAADNNNAYGQLFLGQLLNGKNTIDKQRDKTDDREAWEKCIQNNNLDAAGEAAYWLGCWYNERRGYKYDSIATAYFKMGYEMGSPISTAAYVDALLGSQSDNHTRTAIMYDYYMNPLPEFELKTMMAHNLGYCYANGEGVMQNNQKAIEWYEKAAQLGDVESAYKAAKLYKKENDNQKAIEKIAWAAEQGHIGAQVDLFEKYSNNCTFTDSASAMYWYKQIKTNYEIKYRIPTFTVDEYKWKVRNAMGDYVEAKMDEYLNREKSVPASELIVGKYNWKDFNACIISPDKAQQRYGQYSVQYAISNFYEYRYFLVNYGNPVNYVRGSIWALDSIRKNFNTYQKIVDASTNYSLLDKAEMFRFLGDVYKEDLLEYERIKGAELSKILEHNKVLRDIGSVLKRRNGYLNSCSSDYDAHICYKKAIDLYVKAGKKGSKQYLDALLGLTFIEMWDMYDRRNLSIFESPYSHTTTLSYLVEAYNLVIQLLLDAPTESVRNQYWKEYASLFSTHIPMLGYLLKEMNTTDDNANELIYNAALIYKNYEIAIATQSIDKLLTATWKDIQGKLQNDEAAIEFLKANGPLQEGKKSHYIAAIIRKNSKTPIIKVLSTETEYQKELSQTDARDVSQNIYEYSSEFSNLLWSKVWDELQGVKRVFFSPDGLFYSVAIENLSFADKYIDEWWDARRLSSTYLLLDMPKHTKKHKALLVGGLAFGNQQTHSRNNINYLPETVTEVQQISSLMQNMNMPYTMLMGENGTEEAFRKAATDASILHIATHGYAWDAPQLRRMQIQKWSGMKITKNTAMLQSGLYFAGVNNTFNNVSQSTPSNDGILSAAELSNIDLNKVDFVVLSACNSGKKTITAEGVYGLHHSLALAGVKTTLTSLWEIDDTATRFFMESYYKYYLSGLSPAEALIKTRQLMRDYTIPFENHKDLKIHPYRHPKYWAGFILQDAPR